MEAKRLRRSLKDSVIGGVSGGLGEYFGADPVIFRILFVVLTFTGGGGVLIYLLMWIFIPKAEVDFRGQQYHQSDFNKSQEQESSNFEDTEHQAPINEEEPQDLDPQIIERRKNGNLIGGTLLIMIGAFFLADDFFPWLSWHYLWPAALIIAGLAIIKVNYNSKNK
jgi:phage shock protein PspC (stress-responsive transcriptional regulator)